MVTMSNRKKSNWLKLVNIVKFGSKMSTFKYVLQFNVYSFDCFYAIFNEI